jgi:hypothetical protein
MAGGEYGFIDKTGTMVVNPKFKDASPFYQGLAAVRIDDKWGYIDSTGKVIIEAQYQQAGGFSADGLAVVKVGDKVGWIDKAGKYVWQPTN